MIEKGCNFIYPDEYESLDNEFLSEDLYAKFNERILYRIKSPNPGSYRLKKPNGLLIFGPSGNGKSILVRQFAQLTKLPYIVFNGLDIFEDNIHNSKGGFNIVMKMAHKNSPCVVIVENVETIVPKQTKTTTRFERLEVISNLSLIQNSGENDVFVFATTSRPNEIDAQFAMSGYINELFYASYPDFSIPAIGCPPIKNRPFCLHNSVSALQIFFFVPQQSTITAPFLKTGICVVTNSMQLSG